MLVYAGLSRTDVNQLLNPIRTRLGLFCRNYRSGPGLAPISSTRTVFSTTGTFANIMFPVGALSSSRSES